MRPVMCGCGKKNTDKRSLRAYRKEDINTFYEVTICIVLLYVSVEVGYYVFAHLNMCIYIYIYTNGK